jgi:uncharacterized protein (DUF305 family)
VDFDNIYTGLFVNNKKIMDKNASSQGLTVVVGLLALLLGLGVGFWYGTNQFARFGSVNSGSNMMRGGMMSANIDKHFIEQMIPHHDGAIEMAKIALERSKRAEVLALAKAIIASQEKEIVDMRTWYKAWFGKAVPQNAVGRMMHMGGMTGETEVLQSVPANEFDREFVTQMIPHHEMAVMMAGMLAGGTERPEMQQLARNIIESQSSEITLMRGWLKNW